MAFKKGQSGNPKGRPRLSPAQIDLRAKIREAAPDVIARLIKSAEDGDVGASRLLLERILPTVKPMDEPLALKLPLGEGSPAEAARAVLGAVAEGGLTPDQGTTLLNGIGSLARIIETDEILRRLERLEGAAHGVDQPDEAIN